MLALIAGCILCVSESRFWFALHDYRIEAQSQMLESRLWEVFPKRCLTFWPYLLKDAGGLRDYLERDMPVEIDTRMTGLGKFMTKIKWLQAWVKVQWRGQVWCISEDGRMWLSEQGRPNEDEAGKLIWKIPEQGNLPDEVNLNAPMIGVFKSPLSTEVIASFLEEFKEFKWFQAADEITWERRAGMNLFTLKLVNKTQKIELLLQREKYPGQYIGSSLEEIFDRIIREGGDRIIDATYEGKIFLRKL